MFARKTKSNLHTTIYTDPTNQKFGPVIPYDQPNIDPSNSITDVQALLFEVADVSDDVNSSAQPVNELNNTTDHAHKDSPH